ncbi:hypothetical protein GDO81_013862 [Engystomops pustulosus]|uniref:Secreted protein n=1 Tax=Engystomops pustulosus TaxID=76066 RepID=A0AAV7B675_ENGPU|nr:hypothetical protein GDO81_013862 [Engystomops pustulosus]
MCLSLALCGWCISNVLKKIPTIMVQEGIGCKLCSVSTMTRCLPWRLREVICHFAAGQNCSFFNEKKNVKKMISDISDNLYIFFCNFENILYMCPLFFLCWKEK